ncbi:MAG: PorV/PorQ family protein [Bacteroidales bacterium]|nr:PorV/PorQ family protein [Bacteroidales bacterium]
MTFSYGQSVPFLHYFSDARTSAMGKAGYVTSSPFAVQHNIATILSDHTPATSIGASYLFWQPQATNSALIHTAGYLTTKNVGFAAGVRSHTLGAIEKFDDFGVFSGTISPLEYVLDMGLAFKINKNFSTGVALHYISSDMGGKKKGSAVASSLSLLFKHEQLSVGLGCSYLGSKISYGYGGYGLPTRVEAGVGYRFLDSKKHSLMGAGDVAYQTTSSYEGIIGGVGVEYTLHNLISLRTGYHFEDEKTGVSYPTVGCGLHLFGFSVDFAYMLAQSNHPMYQTMMVSLKWGSVRK